MPLSVIRRWWDSICLRCGDCCCEKIPLNSPCTGGRGRLSVSGRYFINEEQPCLHLDPETGLCAVYSRRFRSCPSCVPMTLYHALFAGYLPEHCGYVRRFRFWRRWREA